MWENTSLYWFTNPLVLHIYCTSTSTPSHPKPFVPAIGIEIQYPTITQPLLYTFNDIPLYVNPTFTLSYKELSIHTTLYQLNHIEGFILLHRHMTKTQLPISIDCDPSQSILVYLCNIYIFVFNISINIEQCSRWTDAAFMSIKWCALLVHPLDPIFNHHQFNWRTNKTGNRTNTAKPLYDSIDLRLLVLNGHGICFANVLYGQAGQVVVWNDFIYLFYFIFVVWLASIRIKSKLCELRLAPQIENR